MLRVNRLLAQDENLRRLEPFATAFRGGSWQRPVSASTISRWENARTRIPHLAIRRYEELLGLTPNTLTSVIDAIYRYWDAGARGRLVLGRQTDLTSRNVQRRLEALLEQATSEATMTGQQWDELTTYLSAGPDAFLPRQTWASLAERLSSESMIAHNLSWAQRYEALNRLLAHPLGQSAAVAACAALAADPANPISIEPISILDGSSATDAGAQVLRQLKSPTNDRAFYGALLASIRKARHRHFNPSQTSALIRSLGDAAAEPGTLSMAYLVSKELLTHLPADITVREITRLRQICAAHQRTQAQQAYAKVVRRRLAGTLADTARAGLPPAFQDEILPDLTTELLHNPYSDERLYTAMLLSASPYARPVASVLTSELATDDHLGDGTLLCAMIEAIRVLGDQTATARVARYIVLPGLPAEVRTTAAYTIGHLDRNGDDRSWNQLITYFQAGWRRQRTATRFSVLKGLVYGLGIAHQNGLLATVRDDPELPVEVRAAASWWLNLPAYVRDSAVA